MSERATRTKPRCTLSSGSGRLWHSIHDSFRGTWTQFLDVEAEAGERGRFVNVACGTSGVDLLHVYAITDDGRLWYSLRRGIHGDASVMSRRQPGNVVL